MTAVAVGLLDGSAESVGGGAKSGAGGADGVPEVAAAGAGGGSDGPTTTIGAMPNSVTLGLASGVGDDACVPSVGAGLGAVVDEGLGAAAGAAGAGAALAAGCSGLVNPKDDGGLPAAAGKGPGGVDGGAAGAGAGSGSSHEAVKRSDNRSASASLRGALEGRLESGICALGFQSG